MTLDAAPNPQTVMQTDVAAVSDMVCPLIQVVAYNENKMIEEIVAEPELLTNYADPWQVVWVNVDGPVHADLTQRIGKVFDLHSLALEDVIRLQERAKVEEYTDYHFLVARMVSPGETLSTEQISVFVTARYVITFQERAGGDCLNPLRDRIRRDVGRIRDKDAAYLVYSILDTIVDAYYPVLEYYGEHLETLEDEISVNPLKAHLDHVHDVKRDLLTLRRAIWPMRDVLVTLMNNSTRFADQELQFFLRDAYDHTLRVIELVETDRELCADLMDFYLSSVGQRTNEVMKVLAIISTIFMPMTFIAGVYGMNFDTDVSPLNMPELEWYFGYPFSLVLMAIFAGAMLYYFHRRGWL